MASGWLMNFWKLASVKAPCSSVKAYTTMSMSGSTTKRAANMA